MVDIDTLPQYLVLIRFKVSEKTRNGTDGRRHHDSGSVVHDSGSVVQWHKKS